MRLRSFVFAPWNRLPVQPPSFVQASLMLVFSAAMTTALIAEDEPAEQPMPSAPVKAPSTPPFFKHECLTELSPAEWRILAELDQLTDIAFSDTPLSEALLYFADFHNIPIVLDVEALNSEAIPLDTPLTRSLTGVKLRSALRILLEPLRMTFVVDDEVLKITTRRQADLSLTTRVYPVSDLCPKKDDVASLADVIRSTVATNWFSEEQPVAMAMKPPGAVAAKPENPGLAKIAAFEPTDCLIVTQTFEGHQQVLQLLRMLRESKRANQNQPARKPIKAPDETESR